jgi:hypothetical protein
MARIKGVDVIQMGIGTRLTIAGGAILAALLAVLWALA